MLEGLNDKQKQAIEHKDGPLLILAGAGSGKTRVLTTRIANLIENHNVDPKNILAITFTNKAAKEMRERLNKLIYGKSYFVVTSTFHSFGLRLLRENYKELGYDKNFTIIDSDDSLTLIKKILKDMGKDPKKYSPYAIKNKISSNKNELISPLDAKKFVFNEFDEVINNVYEKYEQTLKRGNSVDFDDLLLLPLKLFKNDDILNKYQEQFKYILIDEYQDTNQAQYQLTKMLSSKYRNICVVGDNDQSIYGFRGANYKNILNFEKDFPDSLVILLEENYRSTKNILNVANSIIKNNSQRKDKNLWSNNEEGDKISYYRAYNEVDEVNFVIREIKKMIDNGIRYEDIAILYRTNAQSRIIEQEMLKEMLPIKVVGSFYFYNRKEIKDLLSYLRLILNEKDDISLLRVINTPRRGIGLKTIEALEQKALINNKSIFEVIDSGKEKEFKNIILDIKKKSEELTLTELIDYILDKSTLRESLKAEHTLEADIRLENLEEFKSITKSFEDEKGLVSLSEFLQEISLVSDKEEYSDDNNRISLMTVHSVKGLEFDNVFVLGLEEGIFPHINSLMDIEELEEERRLCYVAVTRAKKKLFLVNAKKRMLYGKEQVNIPSRFVNEIDFELLDKLNKEKDEKIFVKEEHLKSLDTDYKVGDKVIHDTYGKGVVIEVSKTLLTVAFDKNTGIKKLIKNHKSINKM